MNSAASETYKLKMGTFESCYPEAILKILANFYKVVVKTGTSYPIGNINFLRIFLRGEVLQ